MSQSTDNLGSYSYGEPLDIALWVDPVMLGREGPFVRHLCMGLKADGHRVSFIAQSTLDLSSLPTLGSRCLSYRWNRWERLGVLQRMRLTPVIEELKATPPDLLVVWGSCDGPLIDMLQLVQHAVPLPTLAWCWDASELFTPLMRLPGLRHVIAASQPIADRGAGNLTLPLTVIHPGAYTDETLGCYDVEGQPPILVSLDPLSDLKAYEALFKACREIADRGHEFLLFVYDTGREEYAIWQLAERLGLLDRISFVPFQQDAEPLMLHGDLYLHVLPTSRVVYRTLEAMGRGLAVVTAPNHAADYLADHHTCRVVRDATPEAWRDVLLDLVRDRGKGTAIARKGQQHVRDVHPMTRTIVQFTSLCRQIVGAPIPLVGR